MTLEFLEGETTQEGKIAYEALAPFYDRITKNNNYVVWCDKLLEMALSAGLRGNRVLDVATGTGKMAYQLRQRGYEVSGCDISPAMLKVASGKPGFTSQDFFLADMRALPACGKFDLVTVVDDALNYCLSKTELLNTFQGISRILDEGGIVVADLNTSLTYSKDFARSVVTDEKDFYQIWNGQTSSDFEPGGMATLKFTFFQWDGKSYQRYDSFHRQRHFEVDTLKWVLREAGLRFLAILGINADGTISELEDEADYMKVFLVGQNS